MSDEINIETKSSKTKLFIIIAAIVVIVLTIVAVLLFTSRGGTAKKVEKQLSLGAKYLSELDYEQAIAAYELAIEIDPKSADAYIGLANTYLAMGDIERAAETLMEADGIITDKDDRMLIISMMGELTGGHGQEGYVGGMVEGGEVCPGTSFTDEFGNPVDEWGNPIGGGSQSGTAYVDSGLLKEISEAEVGDYVMFGSYEQDNDSSNGAEAIKWVVLDKQDGKVLLHSKYALDCKLYHESREEVTWETCSLRSWLNNEFYEKAFTESEQERIAETKVSTPDNSEHGSEGGNDTNDKVFLLSMEEADKYFEPDPRDCPPGRRRQLTEYAKAQGGYSYSEAVEGAYGTTEFDGCGDWWLRTPGHDNKSVCLVTVLGNYEKIGVLASGAYDRVVVPAMWVTY